MGEYIKKTNIIGNKTYTDPVTGKFKKGNPGGGRPLGAKNFEQDFLSAVKEIADVNKITREEAMKILLKKAFSEAKEGNFNYYKDIHDRIYGKAKENVNLTGSISLTQLFDKNDNG